MPFKPPLPVKAVDVIMHVTPEFTVFGWREVKAISNINKDDNTSATLIKELDEFFFCIISPLIFSKWLTHFKWFGCSTIPKSRHFPVEL